MKKIIYIITLAALSLSCSKEEEGDKIIDFNPDFQGRWSSENFHTGTSNFTEFWVINSNSEGYYSYDYGNGASNTEGTILVHEGKIKIDGKHSEDELYSIDEAPVKLGSIGNVWRVGILGSKLYTDKDSQDQYWSGGNSPNCTVFNGTADTVTCTVNGLQRIIPYNQGINIGSALGFGGKNTYSDELGNSFIYVAIFDIDYNL